MKKPRLSPSKVTKFLSCRMAYHWTYNEELTTKSKSFALQVGDVTHLLIHQLRTNNLNFEHLNNYEALVQERYPEVESHIITEITELSIKLLKAYVQKASEKQIRVISSEIHSEVEEAEFFIYGRIDGLGRTQDNKLWRLETKTTAKTDSLYLSGLKTGLQSGIYHYLLNQSLKEPVHGTIFELLIKTKIPYCEISPVLMNKTIMERSLKTFEGVARSIKGGDFYPSSKCVDYGRECDYVHLCNTINNPTRLQEVKQAFYKKREYKP